MKARSIIHIALGLCAGLHAGQVFSQVESWSAWRETVEIDAAAPADTPGVSGGSLVVHATLADFQNATSGHSVTLEDFEGINRPPISFGPCDEPLNHETGQPGTEFLQSCFLPDAVVPAFSIRSNVAQGFGLYGAGTGQFGIDSNFVGNVPGGTSVLVNLHDAPTSVAMDLYDWNTGGEVQVEVYDLDDNLIDSFSVDPASPVSAAFAGFTSDTPVKRVDITPATPGGGLGVDNLRFGGGFGALDIDVGAVAAAVSMAGGALARGADGESLLLDFGDVNVGDQSALPVVLTNVGHLPLQVDALEAPATPFSVTGDDCSGAVLAPDASCTVEYVFSPAHAAGFTAEVGVGSDVPGTSDRTLRMAGQGVQPLLEAGPRVLDFGDVPIGTMTAPRSLSLVNPGAGTVTVSAVDAPGDGFTASGGSCGSVPFDLGPGGTCTLDFSFAPGETGQVNRSLAITSTSPDSPFVADLAGNGVLGGGPDSPFPVPALGVNGQVLLILLMLAAVVCVRGVVRKAS